MVLLTAANMQNVLSSNYSCKLHSFPLSFLLFLYVPITFYSRFQLVYVEIESVKSLSCARQLTAGAQRDMHGFVCIREERSVTMRVKLHMGIGQ